MSVLEALGVLLAGMAAGTINTIVGSGTLITFPTLLFFGYPAVTANVSNTVGLVAGGVTGVHGYRSELQGSGPTLRRLTPASLLGGVLGAVLLLVLPAEAFQAIVPVLIGIGLVLVVFGPALQRRAARRHQESSGRRVAWHAPALVAGVFIGGVYGGYFGAAQGVILMGVMSALSSEPLQRLNGYKNVLATIVNAVAAITSWWWPGGGSAGGRRCSSASAPSSAASSAPRWGAGCRRWYCGRPSSSWAWSAS